jgi:methylphosphotriester-DNA--protein-cysteine methyltransferase
MVRRVGALLERCQPEADERAEVVNTAVEFVAQHPEVTRVTELGSALGVHPRQLERLFQRYTGLTPKWVIRQHRLFEAAARLERGDDVSWAMLSLNLGYFDQAHFSKDFRAVVGESPTAYAERCAGSNSAQH